jgi:hypothetical protein
MFKYRLVDHPVPAIWRSLAAARLRADFPSGKAPTTRVTIIILVLETATAVAHGKTFRDSMGREVGRSERHGDTTI